MLDLAASVLAEHFKARVRLHARKLTLREISSYVLA